MLAEFAPAMLRCGFGTTGLACILGIADTKNVASRRVLVKIGMTFEGYVVDAGREGARYSIPSDDPLGTPPTTRG